MSDNELFFPKITATPDSSESAEVSTELDREQLIAHHIEQLIGLLGYDTDNQHFLATPHRAASVLTSFTKHTSMNGAGRILDVQFIEPGAVNSLVMVGPIRVISYCAHHLLPVTGQAWTGYLPSEKICGLSKLARVTRYFAHQLTVQEIVTQQVVEALERYLTPNGAMCVIKASHDCMSLRGVMEPLAQTTTSAVRGIFRTSANARQEFLSLMREP